MIRVDPVEYLNSHRFTVLFSGGKDSLATLLWVLDNVQHEDWNILYVEITGNTHPLCNEYVHTIAGELGVKNKLIHAKREDLDFFQCMKKWGMPILGKYRWCMNQFKLKVMQKHSHLIQVSGVRASDSPRRRKLPIIELFRMTGNITVKPIYKWSKKQVLEYIKNWGIPLNPCYRIYGHSGNCMFCPYHGKKEIILTLQDPYWRQKILSCLACQRGKTVRYYFWMKYANQVTIHNFPIFSD